MNGLQDFKIEFHEDTAVQGWTQMEHEYIDDCSFVNYMSVNGSEYVIGVYDDRDKAFYQLDRAFSLNMDSTNIDHVSLRVGKLVSKNGEWKGYFMNNKYLLDNCGEDEKILIVFPDEERRVIMPDDLITDFKDSRFIAYKYRGTEHTMFINLNEVKSINIMRY